MKRFKVYTTNLKAEVHERPLRARMVFTYNIVIKYWKSCSMPEWLQHVPFSPPVLHEHSATCNSMHKQACKGTTVQDASLSCVIQCFQLQSRCEDAEDTICSHFCPGYEVLAVAAAAALMVHSAHQKSWFFSVKISETLTFDWALVGVSITRLESTEFRSELIFLILWRDFLGLWLTSVSELLILDSKCYSGSTWYELTLWAQICSRKVGWANFVLRSFTQNQVSAVLCSLCSWFHKIGINPLLFVEVIQ